MIGEAQALEGSTLKLLICDIWCFDSIGIMPLTFMQLIVGNWYPAIAIGGEQ